MSNWTDYSDQICAAGERVLALLPSDDPQLVEETHQMLYAVLARSILALTASHPAQPMFIPELGIGLNFLAPNADTVYTAARISDDGIYRIRGNRGGVHILNMTQISGIGPIKGDLDFDDLHLDEFDNFELIVSAQRPPDYQGDWWQLQPKATSLMVRNVAYDWANETSPVITIDRLDRPPASPRLDASMLGNRIAAMASEMEAIAAAFIGHVAALKSEGFINKLKFIDYSQSVGLTGQFYYETVFELEDDDALLLEVQPPETCHYWSVLLTDDIFATIDWYNRQSSLNGFQAKPDADGRFRLVISRRDPGVPNWLDTGDHRRGAVQGRFTHCGDAKPSLPALRKLPLASLREHLPGDTPMVTTMARDEAVRERREAAQRRRLW